MWVQFGGGQVIGFSEEKWITPSPDYMQKPGGNRHQLSGSVVMNIVKHFPALVCGKGAGSPSAHFRTAGGGGTETGALLRRGKSERGTRHKSGNKKGRGRGEEGGEEGTEGRGEEGGETGEREKRERRGRVSFARGENWRRRSGGLQFFFVLFLQTYRSHTHSS